MIIIEEALAGYENGPPIILQGHIDMVTEKTANCQKDMTKEGLDLYIGGDWLRAKGTMFDADDGVALAYALALLDSPALWHPCLEFICTISEETDMGGIHVVDVPILKGNRMLNLDSDEEGVTFASCIDGGDADIILPVRYAAVRGEHTRLAATSLTGGHSGVEISKGRTNVALSSMWVLTGLRKGYVFRLVSLEGNTKHNATTRETSAGMMLVGSIGTSAFHEAVRAEEAVFRKEYAATDLSLSLTAAIADSEEAALIEDSTKQVLGLMKALPYGVQRMNTDIDGLVETSVNLGIAKLEAGRLTFSYSVRSSTAIAFQATVDKLELISSCFGATALVHNTYPAREYTRESVLRDEAAATYRELPGKEFPVQAIHTGLKCGTLSGKVKNLDAVSIRPDTKGIHTSGERSNIPPTKRVYDFVVEIIKHKSK